MITRETSGGSEGRTCQARWEQCWASPDTLYAILAHIGADVEWFSNPLNYSWSLTRHFTASPMDKIWGMQYDAYFQHGLEESPLQRNWADLRFPHTSHTDNSLQHPHFGVANPPYLREDIRKVCEYAAQACLAHHPVRIWSILPEQCKEVTDVRQMLREAGACILVRWPAFCFSFVPLDFWLGMTSYKIRRATTAPFPVLLAVFQNALAEQHFPLTKSNLRLLQTWTWATLGERSKLTTWDLEASLTPQPAHKVDTDWWDAADAMEELTATLYSTCQWWKGIGQAPMDGVSHWQACWGLVPKEFQEWLSFAGLDQAQSNHLLSQLSNTCISITTPQWIRRCKEVAAKQGQASSAGSVPQPSEATVERQCMRKRKLDAITRGAAIPISRQLGINNWWSNFGNSFIQLWQQKHRWQHLFSYLRPVAQGKCGQCPSLTAFLRQGRLLCKQCRHVLHHSTTYCLALHCSICASGTSQCWWSVGLVDPVCDQCRDYTPDHPKDFLSGAVCPAPLCASRVTARLRNLDLAYYCMRHTRGAPNIRQFTMLRLRQILQQANLHQGQADNSYHPEVLQYLWHLADETREGGVSDVSAPAAAWNLDGILARLTLRLPAGDQSR